MPRGWTRRRRACAARWCVCDPVLAASQPEPELAASALNALGHAVEGPCTVHAHPVATLAAHDAARRLVGAFGGGEPDRDELALGALLAGYTIDSTGFGLHHVLAQTLVRHGLAGHGQANAIMLPHTIPALARRAPEEHAALDRGAGRGPGGGRRARPRADGRDAPAGPRRARGGPRRRRGHGRSAAAARRHPAAGGPRRGARALPGRLVTRTSTAHRGGSEVRTCLHSAACRR